MVTTQGGCPRCGTAAPPEARFCPSCGYATSRLSTGETLDGKYEILDKIGEGGMGEVFRARHLHLDEVRIIKVTKPDALGGGPEPRRFQEEARMATLVRHPNVAALYDFSKLPDGSWYMVWEFIDGITLENWLKRYGPLPVQRALDVAQQVLSGLAQIHAQGIVHRDLSPDNIMLKEGPDGRLHAKIIDLGIAKRVAAESLQMTGTGMFLGKLKYCSPEQAGSLPSGQTVDARSDLYSFGVVLYEMLTGKAPFESQTPEGYLGKHLHAPPPPLPTSRLPSSVGPGLAAVVQKALAKSRERRFADAGQFAQALSRLAPYAAGEIDDATTELLETPRRRWPALLIAAAAVLAVAALVFLALRPRAQPAAPRSIASAPAPTMARPAEPPPDDFEVAAPRIIESRQAQQAGVVRTQPALPAAAPPPVAPAATAVETPPVPTPAPEESRPRAVGVPTAEEARRLFESWKRRPAEPRAHAAIQIANMANDFVAAYPDDPFARELKERLPGVFREEAERARNGPRPLFATLYMRAYQALSFAPLDPEIEERMSGPRRPPVRRRRG